MNRTTILVGTDFSELSKHAAIEAAHQAAQLGLKIKLLHVIQSSKMDPGDWPEGDEVWEQVENLLGELRLYCEAEGAVLEGNPAKLLARESCDEEVALVAVGYSGKSDLLDRIGSVAAKTVRLVDKPTFVFAPDHGRDKSVIGCIDFLSGSESIVSWTHKIAKLEGVETIFVHIGAPIASIIGNTPHLGFLGIPDNSIPVFGSSEEKFKNSLKKRVSEIEGIKSGDKIIVLLETSEQNAIGKLAEASGAGMVVLGRHGHNSFHDKILGSTAERILGLNHRSVLILPIPKI